MTRLYVGNLPWSYDEEDLRILFEKAGEVDSVKITRDPSTRLSKGFAFVEMSTEEEAERAIRMLHKSVCRGEKLFVTEARLPMPNTAFSPRYTGHSVVAPASAVAAAVHA